MSRVFAILMPQFISNENNMRVVEVFTAEGEEVSEGKVLATIETTKGVFDLKAEQSGFVRGWALEEGAAVSVGEPVGWITDSIDTKINETKAFKDIVDFKATMKALELIQSHKLSQSLFPAGKLIREKDVLAVIAKQNTGKADAVEPKLGKLKKNSAVIFGSGGHARVLIDLLKQQSDYEVAGLIVSDIEWIKSAGQFINGVPVVGCDSHAEKISKMGVRYAFMGIGAVTNPALRQKIYEMIVHAGFEVPPLVHAKALVEPSAKLGNGAQIMLGAVVGTQAEIGPNVLVNTSAIVSHDSIIDSHAHIAPGAVLGGAVQVGQRALIGMGATIYMGVKIGRDVVVSNGEAVFSDLLKRGES